jgi:fucose 4-O-acetylase-like acetyltransferase
MENSGIKKRNKAADFLKGFMIFCIMYAHSVSMINGLRGVTWKDSFINVFFTSYEMPLFILIGGYFLWFSLKKRTHLQVLWQRILAIAIPLLIWEGIPAVCNFINVTVNEGFSVINVLKVGLKLVFPGRWFLGCYLMCTILLLLVEWVLSKIKDKKMRMASRIVMYSVLIFVLHCSKHTLNNVAFTFPFFLLGFVLSKYDLLKKKGMRTILLVLAVFFVVLYPFYKPENSYYILGTYILDNTLSVLPIFIHRFVLGLCGCCLLYLIADYLCKKAENNIIVSSTVKLGTKTMELYIVSMFVQEILQAIAGMLIKDTSIITDITAPLLLGPIFLAVMMPICFLIDALIQKNKKLHKIVFGR